MARVNTISVRDETREVTVWLMVSPEGCPGNYAVANKRLKVKFTLEQATTTQRGSRGIALLFL